MLDLPNVVIITTGAPLGPCQEIRPVCLRAGITAAEAERCIGESEHALLVAHDGVATVQGTSGDATVASRVTADPTQAVLIAHAHRVTIDQGSCSMRGFTVLGFRAEYRAPAVDGTLPWCRGLSPVRASSHQGLLAVPWNPQRLFRLAWLERHAGRPVDRGFQREPFGGSSLRELLALLSEVVGVGTVRGAGEEQRRPRASATHRQLTESAKRLVAKAPESPHPLKDVARILGASPHHLAHVFRAHAGVSFHRFLLDLRLAISLCRLSRGDIHLSTLALDLGFATHSHFTAAFRRAVGLPPTRMRRALASTDPPSLDGRHAGNAAALMGWTTGPTEIPRLPDLLLPGDGEPAISS